jgi:N utilization substance protein B
MPSHHRSRERALQMIYQWDQTGVPPQKVIEGYWGSLSRDESGESIEPDPFANDILLGVVGGIEKIDGLIRKHAANWRLERMSAVDRSILRMAIYEMLQDVSLGPVIIDEALDIGRRFSGQDAVPFLNGVLDAVRRSLEKDELASVGEPAG